MFQRSKFCPKLTYYHTTLLFKCFSCCFFSDDASPVRRNHTLRLYTYSIMLFNLTFKWSFYNFLEYFLLWRWMTISTFQKLPQCTSPVWMDWLCLEDRAQCLGFLLLLENCEIAQYIKFWGLNHFSGSYASAMAGAAAGGEQNKAQPSNSSQRNRNSKSNNFTSMMKSVLTWSA